MAEGLSTRLVAPREADEQILTPLTQAVVENQNTTHKEITPPDFDHQVQQERAAHRYERKKNEEKGGTSGAMMFSNVGTARHSGHLTGYPVSKSDTGWVPGIRNPRRHLQALGFGRFVKIER